MHIVRLTCFLAMISFSGYIQAAQYTSAPPSWVPAGLSPGDLFYVIYLSENVYRGDLAKSAYNGIGNNESSSCNEAASIINSGGSINTLYSHVDGLNTTNLLSVPAPIYDVDGNLVSEYADFWSGGNLQPINKTCTNTPPGNGNFVWTGFNANGTTFNPLGAGGASAGFSNRFDTRWARGDDSETTDNTYHLYLISTLLAVPSPTPPIQGSSIFKDWE